MTYREYVDKLIAEGKCPHVYGIKQMPLYPFTGSYTLICINCKETKPASHDEMMKETGGYFYIQMEEKK
jgi:hypothetical protein